MACGAALVAASGCEVGLGAAPWGPAYWPGGGRAGTEVDNCRMLQQRGMPCRRVAGTLRPEGGMLRPEGGMLRPEGGMRLGTQVGSELQAGGMLPWVRKRALLLLGGLGTAGPSPS